jgi:ParB family chromosome partitioning protein
VRTAAARALEGVGDEATRAALTEALGDPEASVRAAAARALTTTHGDRSAALATAVRPFDPVSLAIAAKQPGHRDAELATDEGRRLALPTMIVARETAPLVSIARTGADLTARLDAIAALGLTGGADAAAVLTELAFDKKGGDVALRKAAYRALRRARRVDERRQAAEEGRVG